MDSKTHLVVVLAALLLAPSTLAQESADLIFCPCSGCDHAPFVKQVSQCGCLDAQNLRKEMGDLEAQGKSFTEIEDIYVARFGEQALVKPRPKGFGLAARLLGGIALILGFALILFVGRRWKARAVMQAPVPAPLSSSDEEKVRLALESEIETD